ncbi:MAG TPA: DUF4118 domain-containing protein [Armatimonadota bacterium]|nr:DUF4118 domain-containing protein [Armatimonadota bacterium]
MPIRSIALKHHGYVIAVASVFLTTLLFLPGRDHFVKSQWALLYLLLIGIVAAFCGIRAALVAAILAIFAWNFFFIPPFHTLNITDPNDLLSLLVFSVVGVTLGLLAGYLREREAQASAREEEIILLNRLSTSLVSLTSADAMAAVVQEEIAGKLHVPRQAIFLADGDGHLSALAAQPTEYSIVRQVAHLARWAYHYKTSIGLPEPPRDAKETWPISKPYTHASEGDACCDLYLLLHSSTRVEGVLYVGERQNDRCYSVEDARLLISIANLIALFLERLRLQETAYQNNALREADRLKSTLISSVSHELKTPLAAMTATVTSLLEDDVHWDMLTIRHELGVVRDDLERLNGSIGELVDFARLESDAWQPQRDWYELGEIFGVALNKFPEDMQQRITEEIPDDFPLIYVDFQQLARAFQHLLENALAYSQQNLPIRVGARHLGRYLECWVQDCGPGIPEEERTRIFEKFYRGNQASSVPSGTGLGLAITAEIVRFHGGRIWVEDGHPSGARFVMHLPCIAEDPIAKVK